MQHRGSIFRIIFRAPGTRSSHSGRSRRARWSRAGGQDCFLSNGWLSYVTCAQFLVWLLLTACLAAFNIIAFSFPNISIAILVNNLLDPNLWRTRALFTLVLLEVFFALVSVMILFLMCSPVEYLWDKSVVGGSCWSPNVMNDFSYWLSAFDALTDIVLAAIPISAFCKLQMRFKTKVGVCIMMGLTILSAIFTIIKASYLWLLFRAPDPCEWETLLQIPPRLTTYSFRSEQPCHLGAVSTS